MDRADGSVQEAHWYEGNPWRRFELWPAGTAAVGRGIAAVSRIPGSLELWCVGVRGALLDSYWYG